MIVEMWALTVRELKKWRRTPFLILMTMIQPIAWLALFGKALNPASLVAPSSRVVAGLPRDLTASLPTILESGVNEALGTSDYFTYMAAGMLSVIVLFGAMMSGMSVVWDRRTGFLNKLIVAPIPRSSIVLSKVAYSVIRGVVQAALVFVIAYALGMKLHPGFGPLQLLVVALALLLLSVGFSSVFVAISIRVTKWETQATITNLMNLPLMFASSALFPIYQMPEWLQVVARLNPITYSTDAVRRLILDANSLGTDLGSIALNLEFLGLFATVFALLGIILARKALKKG